MGLEAATYIHQLNPANPVGAVDPKAQGDDHIRLVKVTLQATFANIAGAVTVTHTQLNNLAAMNLTGFAAPSVLIDGTAAAAGAATTALRSDARLQINLASNYTWTGVHVFNGATMSGSAAATWSGRHIFARAGNAEKLALQSADTDGDVFLAYYENNGVTRKGYIGYGDTNTDHLYIANEENASILFAANGATRFSISATGVLTAAGTADWGGIHTFTAGSTVLKANDYFLSFNNAAGAGIMDIRAVNGSQAYIAVLQAIPLSFYTNSNVRLAIAAGGGLTVNVGGTAPTGGNKGDGTVNAVGLYTNGDNVRSVPRSTTVTTLAIGDLGKCVAVSAAINIPASVFAAGDCVSIYNDSAASVNITISAGTLRLAGTTTTGTRALAARGLATLWFNVGGATPEVIASGAGVS